MAFPVWNDLAGLVGRLALGAIFLAHGWPKVKDIQKTIGWVKGTGWPGGAAFAALFSLLEFFGGIALILGLLTHIVAILFVLEMLATTVFSKVKLQKKFILGYQLEIEARKAALIMRGEHKPDRRPGIVDVRMMVHRLGEGTDLVDEREGFRKSRNFHVREIVFPSCFQGGISPSRAWISSSVNRVRRAIASPFRQRP